MGSAAIQGALWDKGSEDWAAIQEQTGNAGYQYGLSFLKLDSSTKVLDVGCGSGLFLKLASQSDAIVTGIDASPNLVEQARKRNPKATLQVGEMERLPFADCTFDVVCGFNSIQYAASAINALNEVKRVLKDKGRFLAMIWGNKEDCEAATYLKAVGSLLPTPPPGAPGPFALSENRRLEALMEEGGFAIIESGDIRSVWEYPDINTALKGLMSAGPVARAIGHVGFEKTLETIAAAVKPYEQSNGHVVYQNKFRIVTATVDKS